MFIELTLAWKHRLIIQNTTEYCGKFELCLVLFRFFCRGLIQKFIGCEKCKEWFHPRCVGLTDVKAEKMAKFICPNCSSQPQFRDFLFRKLRMPLDGAVLLAVIEEHLERSRVVEMFRNPVSLADVPNYTDVIQEPMGKYFFAKVNCQRRERFEESF